MRYVWIGLGVVVGLIVLVLVVGLFLPGHAHVERSIVIDAPPAAVYAKVVDLHEWEDWSPWNKERDPTMEVTYSGAEQGAGAKYAWTSENLGAGNMEITKAVENKLIEADLYFEGQGDANVDFAFEPEGDGTKVTWGFDDDLSLNPIERYFCFFLMDPMLGADYEQGLSNLKTTVESEAAPDGDANDAGPDGDAQSMAAPAKFREELSFLLKHATRHDA